MAVEIPDAVVEKALDGYCTVPTYGTYRGQFDAMRAALVAARPYLMPTQAELADWLNDIFVTDADPEGTSWGTAAELLLALLNGE